MEAYRVVQAGSKEEAIEKSGLYVGQPATVSRLFATGNLNGQWTVHPEFSIIEPYYGFRLDERPTCNVMGAKKEG